MTWIAPEVPRPVRKSVADERTALDSALDFQRSTFLFKCGGLTAEQLASRSVGHSTLSLLGLARHLAECERMWFRYRFAAEPGITGVPLFFTEDDPDGDFLNGTAESAEGDLEVYRTEVAAARAATEGRSLEDTFLNRGGQPADLRWLFFHMIEEYARHNGHADLLREHIDGRTGE